MSITRKRFQSNPSIMAIAHLFSDAMLDVHGIDVNQKGMLSNNFYSSISRFVNVYGEENAKKIIQEAYYGKHHGMYRGRIISDYLFIQGFDWLSKELLIDSLMENTSWK